MIVSDLPAWAIRAFAFLFGALWGSFFNVAIYRWPRDMSVVTPPSHCPHCKAPVPAYRNVPILGYLAGLGFLAWGLGILIPTLALSVRRLRDAGLHWAWILLSLVPFGGIALIVLWCQPSKYP